MQDIDHDGFVYCLGIGIEHKPCNRRESCWRHKALRRTHFHIPVKQMWHLCAQGATTEKVFYLDPPEIAEGADEGEEVV